MFKYIPAGGFRLFTLSLLLFFACIPATYAQCSLSASPKSITFTNAYETKSIYITRFGSCSYRAGAPAFMSVTLSENEITVSLNNKDPLDYIAHNGNTSGINITLFDPQTYAFLLKIPVYLRLIPHPLKAGSIRCNTKSIPPGISPGTIENITDPSGGNGNYAYRWQKSTNNGST